MAGTPTVTRIADGAYRVEHDGRSTVVYVAGPPENRWAFWNGRVFRVEEPAAAPRRVRGHVAHALTAPMPATVIKVLVEAGASLRKGDTILVLEAMKMELPIRAAGDARVVAVNCKEGELVQPDTVLVELE